MAITITCACGKTLRVKDEGAGKRLRCPACAETVLVPDAAPATPGGGSESIFAQLSEQAAAKPDSEAGERKPRRKGGKKKKKRAARGIPLWLWIGGGAGAGLLVAVGVVLAVMLRGRPAPRPGSDGPPAAAAAVGSRPDTPPAVPPAAPDKVAPPMPAPANPPPAPPEQPRPPAVPDQPPARPPDPAPEKPPAPAPPPQQPMQPGGVPAVPMPAEGEGLFIRVKSVPLRKKPEDKNGGKETLEFRDFVQVRQRLGEWIEVSCPARQRQGWIHPLAATASKDELDGLQTKGRIPRSITRIEGHLGPLRKGVGNTNLVGSRTVDLDKLKKMVDAKKIELTIENQVGDCVLFTTAAVEELTGPDKKLWLSYMRELGLEKIVKPERDKVYVYTEARRFEVLPLSTLDERALDALVDKAPRR